MAKERKPLGVAKTILLLLSSVLIIAAAVVVPQAVRNQNTHKLENAMKQDLLSVKSNVAAGLKKMSNPPTIKFSMKSLKDNWSFTTFDGIQVASGTASKGDFLSGSIYHDSSFCLQVGNSGSSKIWHIDSTTMEPVTGFCVIKRATMPSPSSSATPMPSASLSLKK